MVKRGFVTCGILKRIPKEQRAELYNMSKSNMKQAIKQTLVEQGTDPFLASVMATKLSNFIHKKGAGYLKRKCKLD